VIRSQTFRFAGFVAGCMFVCVVLWFGLLGLASLPEVEPEPTRPATMAPERPTMTPEPLTYYFRAKTPTPASFTSGGSTEAEDVLEEIEGQGMPGCGEPLSVAGADDIEPAQC
jgi:hypothetical protein